MMNPLPLLGEMPEKIEAGSSVIWEKRDPVYESTLFGVPIKYIGLGIIIFKIFRRL